MFQDFMAFLTKSNALALAIGVIIGAAMGDVVKSLVNDIIMPPIGLLLGGVDFSKLAIHLKDAYTNAQGVAVPATEIRVGVFVNTVISFIIIAFVVFLIARALIREKKEEPAGPSDEVKLLTEIRDELKAR